jgi:hypothetical protein
MPANSPAKWTIRTTCQNAALHLEIDVKPIRHLVVSIAVVAGAVFATATAAAASPATTASASTTPRTVAEAKQHVAQQSAHILAHLAELRPRVAANKRFTAAEKTLLNADMAALQTATTAAGKKIAADTTLAQIRADRPLLAAVLAKRIKLQTDLAAARANPVAPH